MIRRVLEIPEVLVGEQSLLRKAGDINLARLAAGGDHDVVGLDGPGCADGVGIAAGDRCHLDPVGAENPGPTLDELQVVDVSTCDFFGFGVAKAVTAPAYFGEWVSLTLACQVEEDLRRYAADVGAVATDG